MHKWKLLSFWTKDKGDVTGAGPSSTSLFLVLFLVRDRAFVSMNPWSGLWLLLNTGKPARPHQHQQCSALPPCRSWWNIPASSLPPAGDDAANTRGREIPLLGTVRCHCVQELLLLPCLSHAFSLATPLTEPCNKTAEV